MKGRAVRAAAMAVAAMAVAAEAAAKVVAVTEVGIRVAAARVVAGKAERAAGAVGRWGRRLRWSGSRGRAWWRGRRWRG